jgi:ATPase family protein associated with various cellular activities (AAA)/winged helix domain-containing protein
MSSAAHTNWYEANQAHLAAALSQVRSELESFLANADSQEQSEKVRTAEGAVPAANDWPFSQPPALEHVCSLFELSTFERKVLLMCAGAEMDSRFPVLYAAVHKDAQRTQPTFSLALSVFADAHWSAVTPVRPLRQWHLLQVSSGETLATSPLRIQERVLHFLAGVHCLDERLQGMLQPLADPGRLPDSHFGIARQIAAAWSRASTDTGLPIIQLCGHAGASKRNIAAAASTLAGLRLHAASGWTLPQVAADAELLRRLWEREAVLTSSALLLECEEDNQEALSAPATSWLMESIRSPLIVSTRAPRKCGSRSALLFDVDNPTRDEQSELWRDVLQPSLPQLNGKLDTLVTQFNLGAAAIRSAAWQAGSQPSHAEARQEQSGEALADRLWDACRIQARPRLEGLAQRLDPAAGWDDLVLPQNQKQVLRQIAVHVRQRGKVYQSWGFACKSSRGLGISALFAGPSGTGKTMAAEVLANELRLDLYRIDLSQVVSKYIGETEKNLRRVFDAAEEGAAVLLFDEADALFGKRSEVKDSHDRYANIEVSYLLQRMEAYRGLAILTTNRKSALDQAFLRRIRFVIEFPFPEVTERAEIWRRVFPQATPTDGLKLDRLARLHVAGGHIRNIAVGAAFLAADAGEPIRMSHLLHSARSEFAKMEKPLPDAEVAGWL